MEFVAYFIPFLLQSDEGCLTQVYCAVSPEIEEKNYKSQYFVPTAQLSTASNLATNDELAEKLWSWTEEIVTSRGFSLKLEV